MTRGDLALLALWGMNIAVWGLLIYLLFTRWWRK